VLPCQAASQHPSHHVLSGRLCSVDDHRRRLLPQAPRPTPQVSNTTARICRRAPNRSARHAVADVVARDFTAERRRGPAGRDISYIKTWQGWLRLEAVIDLEQGRDRLCDGRAHTRPAGHRRAGDGGRATTSSKKTALCLSTAAAKYMSGEYSATFAELELRQSVGHTRILLG